MTPKWVVEQTDNSEELVTYLKENKIEVTVLPKFSYVADDFKFPYPYECVICHGSIQMAKELRGRGFFFDFEALKYSSYHAHYGKYHVCETFERFSCKELPARKEEIYEKFGVARTIFLRPDDNEKSFTGKLVAKEIFDKDTEWAVTNLDVDVIVSQPWTITHEWRFFVRKGEIITGSQYRADGMVGWEKEYPDEAAEIALKIANEQWQPHPLFVVDVCLSGDEYCLLEIGSWNCAGYYKADLNKLVPAANEIYLKEFHS